MDSENFKHFWNNILKPNLLKKVDKISGKGLSTNDFTDTYKNAIGSLQDSVGALNTTKVDKVIGKDLSTNDFTNEYKDLIVANKDAISKLNGFIYPCTAQALEAMTQEQQAELYVQGYRAIKTENNGTVVLLGLAADGSLEWLGCNKDTTNMLDNSDFSNPINQRGLTTYSGSFIYSIDRWVISGTISLQSGGISVSPNGFFLQRMEPLINGEDYTLAAYVGNQLLVGTVTYDSVSSDSQVAVSTSLGTLYIQNIEGNLCQFTANTVAQSIISMPVLLKGAYTAKTLPPWVPPTYMIELAKCLGRYQIMYVSLFSQNTYQAYASRFNTLVAMMGTPTVTLYTTDKQTQGFLSRGDGTDAPASVNAVNITNTGCNIQSSAGNFVAEKQYNGYIAFSYDL